MAFGDPHGAFGASGGFGGNFPGAGGSSLGSSPGGPDHGALGFGGMSPGGYNSTTYNQNAMGYGGPGSGVPGFGNRVINAARARQRAIAAAQGPPRQATGRGGVISATVSPPAPVDPITGQPPAPANPITGQPPAPVTPQPKPSWGNWPNINNTTGYPVGRDWELGNHPGFGGHANWDNAVSHNTPIGGLGNQYPGGGQNTRASVGNRQFGGPVEPGQQYTVGENGPETLQMGANGGGQVTPMNPADQLGGMNPQMMRDMFQLQMGQRGKPPGQAPVGMPAPAGPAPLVRPPNTVPRVAPTMPRPQTPSMGFGGSGMGQQGVMGRLRSQLG